MPRVSKPWWRAASGTWVSRVRGKLETLAHGKANKAAAAAKLRALLASQKIDSPVIAHKSVDAVSLDELKDQFTELYLSQLARSSSERWGKLVGRFVVDLGPGKAASGLVALDLLRWVDGTGWNRTTRSNGITAVKRMFSWGVQMGLLSESRVAGCPKPGAERREVCPTSDEVSRVVAACVEPFKAFALVLAETGARPSELARARVGQLDSDGHRLILTKHKTAKKTGKPRIIYLTDRAAEVVSARCAGKDGDSLIFTNLRGTRWDRSGIGYRFRVARDWAGVGAHVTAYSFRHWWITERLRAGVSMAIVAELAGTSVQVIQSNYSHLSDHAADLRAAVERRA